MSGDNEPLVSSSAEAVQPSASEANPQQLQRQPPTTDNSQDALTPEQTQALEALWKKTETPSLDEGLALAVDHSLKPAQIQLWFKLRRSSSPQPTQTAAPPPPSTPPNARSSISSSSSHPLLPKSGPLPFPGPPSGSRKPHYSTYAYSSPDHAPANARVLLGIEVPEEEESSDKWKLPELPAHAPLAIEEQAEADANEARAAAKGEEEPETEVLSASPLSPSGEGMSWPRKGSLDSSSIDSAQFDFLSQPPRERRHSTKSRRSSSSGEPSRKSSTKDAFPVVQRQRRSSADTESSVSSPSQSHGTPSRASISSSTNFSSSRPSFSATSSPRSRPAPANLSSITSPSSVQSYPASYSQGAPSIRSVGSGSTRNDGPQSIFANPGQQKRGMADLLAAVAKPVPQHPGASANWVPPQPKQSRFSKLLGGKKAQAPPQNSLSMFGPRPGGSASILDAALTSSQGWVGAGPRPAPHHLNGQQIHPDALAEALARSGVRGSAPSVFSNDSASIMSRSPTGRRQSEAASTHESVSSTPNTDRSAYTGAGQRVAPSKRAPVFAAKPDAKFLTKRAAEGATRSLASSQSAQHPPTASSGLGLEGVFEGN